MLRRVVKDHSDIKNPVMMRRPASVWHLKEIRDYSCKVRFIGNTAPNILLFPHSAEAFAVLMRRHESLQIDSIFLSFLLFAID
ncbi:hypothetical protein [Burkholderia sp. S-53]|uniref:hypothetical protein n=1 Tax=Burkholderia sp. S-53 TaxID=2906514 RepID=UPI0021D0F349|nr:hypothetical protein [Burkholderia sp. S-53]UXU89970.1 hypothetical protein LXM88_32100 [Burkholderia sp. S-53]